ncbi:MAG TPA: enoyl-CoA hydratase-related protein [Burkholderiaceae bacterium]|nr:enoyl-CoA hydratase-related protein [Burkholderiaceae bacterium]
MPLITSEKRGRVVLVRLNRPEALNALSQAMLEEILTLLEPLDSDDTVGCFVITGNERAFAAGADIKEMAPRSLEEMFGTDYFGGWERFAALRTPKIAAVAGHALGGGCELAMMCDFVYAADNARFGQPEVRIGVMPGIGGTQRLTRLIGRSKAMELILTGRSMNAREAEQAGLVARVFAPDELLPAALEAAEQIAGYGRMAVMAAREAVARAEELSLREGVLFERRVFHALFATADQKEGMQAFLEKRPPRFGHTHHK